MWENWKNITFLWGKVGNSTLEGSQTKKNYSFSTTFTHQ